MESKSKLISFFVVLAVIISLTVAVPIPEHANDAVVQVSDNQDSPMVLAPLVRKARQFGYGGYPYGGGYPYSGFGGFGGYPGSSSSSAAAAAASSSSGGYGGFPFGGRK